MALFGSEPLPADISSDNALILLIAILAEINTATTVFHSLENQVGVNSNGQALTKDLNPYLPFSVTNEASRARRKLTSALVSWHQSYSNVIEPKIYVLFYLCRLQLVFPNVQYLPILAGYPPRVLRNITPTSVLHRRVEQDLKGGADALRYAWLILENCTLGSEETPVWFPIAVFHASLAVWSMIVLDGETRGHGSLKVLAVFKMELEGMKWPCCREMADVLGLLMKGEHTVPMLA